MSTTTSYADVAPPPDATDVLDRGDFDDGTRRIFCGSRRRARRIVGPRRKDRRMTKTTAVLAAVLALAAVAAAGTAGADPTPAPTPGYQIPSESGPQFPGAQVYPPQCLRNMLAFALAS